MKISESMSGGPQKAYSWNAVLQFKSNTAESFSDKQLAGLAQEAKRQIDEDYVCQSKPITIHWHPQADNSHGGMAIVNSTYIASSVKTSNYMIKFSSHERKSGSSQDLNGIFLESRPTEHMPIVKSKQRRICSLLSTPEGSMADGVV